MADTRTDILEACKRLIARDGIRALRMQAVAREANVSIGLLSYHFGDRDGLLRAALEHVSTSTAVRAAEGSRSADPRDRLTALLTNEFGETPAIRAGSTAWNELRAAAVFDPQHAASVAAATEHWHRTVAALLYDIAPERSTEEIDQMTLQLTALVEGLSGRWLTGQLAAADAQQAITDTVQRWCG